MLAQACDLGPDSAYLAGMQLRTGELLILMTEPESIALAESRAKLPGSLMDHQLAVMHCHHAEVMAELARRWRFPQAMDNGLKAAGDPMAARPFSKLGAVLRIASVLADAGDQGLPPVDTLVETQGELVAHLHRDLDWLGQHLLPYALLCSGVDQMLH